ncbi:hypothetical protein C1646_750862 [Rhizophagus diaphanus]|nr:hypothetical protein C1646_750862 [Rhizophagus diaphanus] [Rhizophagus sp. MUCL 43196]
MELEAMDSCFNDYFCILVEPEPEVADCCFNINVCLRESELANSCAEVCLKLVVTRTKMLHEAVENTTDLNLNSGLASLLLINQEEDLTITSLEENLIINLINEDILIIPPLNEEILVITPLEEDSTIIPLNEKDNSTTPKYNKNEYIFLP